MPTIRYDDAERAVAQYRESRPHVTHVFVTPVDLLTTWSVEIEAKHVPERPAFDAFPFVDCAIVFDGIDEETEALHAVELLRGVLADAGLTVFEIAEDWQRYRPAALAPRWQIINTWNGGKRGRVVEFTSTARGDAGHNECFVWIHRHTSYSFSWATTHGGYAVIPAPEEG